jgi:hypothetical protein
MKKINLSRNEKLLIELLADKSNAVQAQIRTAISDMVLDHKKDLNIPWTYKDGCLVGVDGPTK